MNQHREELARVVAKILAEVIGIDKISPEGDFCDSDVTSLQAIRVCARIERELGCQVLPRWLISSRSLADFVKLLQAGEQKSDV